MPQLEIQAIQDVAERLRAARVTRTPCPPIRGLLGDGSIDDAYAVQALNTASAEKAGARVVGWKVGLTSPAVQKQLGVDQPDFGVLLAEWSVADGGRVPCERLLQPRVEAEVAFVLGSDLPEREVTHADVVRATRAVRPAIEIVDSRIADWDITIVDTVADNASSGLYVLGDTSVGLDGLDLPAVAMTLEQDGNVVSTGTGAACLDDPVEAVVWLANTLAGVGQSLLEGHVVLSGSLGPVVAVQPGSTYRADLSALGSVEVTFEAGSGS